MVERHDLGMDEIKRVTANLPADLLQEARVATGKGITETLIDGLLLLKRSRAYEMAMALKGKIDLDVDMEASRERRR
jgi:hypothetical protein